MTEPQMDNNRGRTTNISNAAASIDHHAGALGGQATGAKGVLILEREH